MKEPRSRSVEVNGEPCRVWDQGEGEPIVFLPGLGGLPRWTPFLDQLAGSRRVIVPSIPGYPGSLGHDRLGSPLDWAVATRELLEQAGAVGADLVGVSAGGSLAAEMAALWPADVPRLVLAAPLGLYDPAEPITDIWAQKPTAVASLLCLDPARYVDAHAPPPGADPVEWQVEEARAAAADARRLWPMCDTGIEDRLHRIDCPTLLVWGEEDRVIAPSYADRFADRITGATELRGVSEAGHLIDLDAPAALAGLVLDFLTAPAGADR